MTDKPKRQRKTVPVASPKASGRKLFARHRPLDRSALLLRVTSAGETHRTITTMEAEKRYGGLATTWTHRAQVGVIRGLKVGSVWLLSEPDVRRFVVEGPEKDDRPIVPRKPRAPRKPRVRKKQAD